MEGSFPVIGCSVLSSGGEGRFGDGCFTEAFFAGFLAGVPRPAGVPLTPFSGRVLMRSSNLSSSICFVPQEFAYVNLCVCVCVSVCESVCVR